MISSLFNLSEILNLIFNGHLIWIILLKICVRKNLTSGQTISFTFYDIDYSSILTCIRLSPNNIFKLSKNIFFSQLGFINPTSSKIINFNPFEFHLDILSLCLLLNMTYTFFNQNDLDFLLFSIWSVININHSIGQK